MSVKVIGIGNVIMSDDGIGVLIARSLKKSLEKHNIEVVIGECDVEYCLSCIEEGDLLFIIDAGLYGLVPGELIITDIKDVRKELESGYSQHQMSLVKLISNYNLKNISAYVIAIEVENIDFGVDISKALKDKFEHIQGQIYDFIISKGGEGNA